MLMGFATACNDDDDAIIGEPVITPVDKSEIVIDTEALRIKVGTPEAINISAGAGEYHAFSLNPSIADIITDGNGGIMIEGKKCGNTEIVVSDRSGSYKKIPASVYTDIITLTDNTVTLTTPLGHSKSTKVGILLGNGGYAVECDNDDVDAILDEDMEEITLTAVSRMQDFLATVTITDSNDITTSLTVTVKHTLEAFSDSDIEELCGMPKSAIDINGDMPYYFRSKPNYMFTETEGDITSFGWKYFDSYRQEVTDWLYFEYPVGTPVGVTVKGHATLGDYYTEVYSLDGNVKIVKDDDFSKVAIFWSVDEEAEMLNRGYVVHIK